MTEPTTPPAQPTPEQLAAANEVTSAVATAAASAETPAAARESAAAAARETADRVNLEIPEEQITAIANGVVAAMEARGAFDAPPEPITPPPAVPPGPTAADPSPAPAPVPDQPPTKRTFAQRFLGE